MTGTWVGTYSETFGENGTLTAVLVQSGTSVTGTQTIVGNPGSASPGTYSSSVTGTLTSLNGVQNFIFGPLFFGGEQGDGVGTVSANCSTTSGSFITPGGVNIGTYSAKKQ